jgi:hypothetical protein
VKVLSYAELTRMFTIYLHRNFHLPRSSGSLDISAMQKAKYMFYAAIMLLFYILQKYFSESWIFFEGYYDTRFLGHILIGPNVAHVLQFLTTAIFLLLLVGKYKLQMWRVKSIPRLIKIRQLRESGY